MAAPGRTVARLTAKEYFALEAVAEEKHELVDGELFSMAGGTRKHAQLTARLVEMIGPQLAGSECRSYSSDLRVMLRARTYAYPDYTVICGEAQSLEENEDTVTNPTVVFEVLSPSTELYDRGLKLALYKTRPPIRTIILVGQAPCWVEVHERQPDGGFLSREYESLDAEITLPAISATLRLRELYDGIDFA